VDDPRLEAQAQAQETVASVHMAAGRLDEAMAAFDRALGLASATGRAYTEAQALTGIAVALTARGDAGPALAVAEAALRLARRARYLVLEGQALVAAADAALMLGQPDVAHEHARAAPDVHQRSGYVPGLAAADRVFNLTPVGRRGGDPVVPAPSRRLIRPA
jgi:tetratricopeptide (TPR) repeat protein